MNYEEIKRRVSAWGVQTEFSTSDRAAIEQMYFDVLGKHIRNCNCPDRYRDAVIELRIFTKNHLTMEKAKYVLKAGVVIQPSGTSEVYTNDNLTDAVAEQFLKERPGARGLFEVIPNTPAGEKGPENEKEAANSTDIDALRAENESLKAELETAKAELAKMTVYRDRAVADLDALVKKIEESKFVLEPRDPAPAPEESADAGKVDEGTDENKGSNTPAGLNPEIYAAIKARLEAGDTKSAIVADYVGMEVDGKALTKYGVEKYFTAIKAETPAE